MKEKYERLTLTVTQFDAEDVITTSVVDRNNVYIGITDLDGDGGKAAPPGPWN